MLSFTLFPSTIDIWNKLPNNVVNAATVDEFKINLYLYVVPSIVASYIATTCFLSPCSAKTEAGRK